MERESVDVIITDPPYDLSIEEKEMYHRHFLRVCKRTIIVFCPPENQWPSPVDQYLFWAKPISTKNTSRRYSRFVEMICVYDLANKKDVVWNSNRHWSNYVNVFSDYVDDIKDHPHRKPMSLINRLLLNHTKPGDLVFDPFAGSAVVLESAKLNKRNYIGCEIDKEYYWKGKARLDE